MDVSSFKKKNLGEEQTGGQCGGLKGGREEGRKDPLSGHSSG